MADNANNATAEGKLPNDLSMVNECYTNIGNLIFSI